MRTVMVKKGDRLIFGVKRDPWIVDVEEALRILGMEGKVPRSPEELVGNGEEALKALDGLASTAVEAGMGLIPLTSVKEYGPCLTRPGKILCVGLNYRAHAEETRMELPQEPLLFSKFTSALSGHGERVAIPEVARKVDYEAELVIVMGRWAVNLTPEEALGAVYGYCCGNDLSARDLQFRTSQWLLGKTLDGFCPLGPELVSAGEVGNPGDLAIRCYLNGELRQDSRTSQMIFSCAQLVSYISRHMTLEPGDIILTGTPPGVIAGHPRGQKVWLKAGDEVTVEIEGLGRLTTYLV